MLQHKYKFDIKFIEHLDKKISEITLLKKYEH